MQCNIDARGKAIRFRMGLLLAAAAAGLAVLKLAGVLAAPAWWFAVAGVGAGAAFVLFEARAGWCVVRAAGLRTPF